MHIRNPPRRVSDMADACIQPFLFLFYFALLKIFKKYSYLPNLGTLWFPALQLQIFVFVYNF